MKESPIAPFLGNEKTPDFGQTDFYAGIIGESPSRGARSPSLWNAAFEGLGISAMMHPMDVAVQDLAKVVEAMRSDTRFIGSAVAVPHKQRVTEFLDRLEPEAEAIGAVNCIYREGEELVGANTDGAGAVESLVEAGGGRDLKGKSILVMGIGGAGSAVAAYAAAGVGKEGSVVLANRSPGAAERLAERLAGFCPVRTSGMPVKAEELGDKDVLINCTVVGYGAVMTDASGARTLEMYTPLGPVDDKARVEPGEGVKRRYAREARESILKNLEASLAALQHTRESAQLFDIIYQPAQTTFLRLGEGHGLGVLNGLAMNLYQAVIGFRKATEASQLWSGAIEEVRDLMRQVG